MKDTESPLQGVGGCYNRKYYLIRKIKADGYGLEKADGFRTILVPPRLEKRFEANSALNELRNSHQFRVRIVAEEPKAEQTVLAFRDPEKRRILHMRRAEAIIKSAIRLANFFK